MQATGRAASAGKEPTRLNWPSSGRKPATTWPVCYSPPALEEFLLRYSQNANDLRTEFWPTPILRPHARRVSRSFQARTPWTKRIQLLADATDPGSVAARKALEDQRDNAIKAALGSKRYEE